MSYHLFVEFCSCARGNFCSDLSTMLLLAKATKEVFASLLLSAHIMYYLYKVMSYVILTQLIKDRENEKRSTAYA